MVHYNLILISTFYAVIFFASCNNGPKVIPLPTEDLEISPPINNGLFQEEVNTEIQKTPEIDNDVHTVKVNEILPAEKYIYLNVSEGEETFWIVTIKKEVQVGEYYIYSGSYLQTNFKSKEHNRTFEEIHFVSNIVPVNHGLDKDLSSKPTRDQKISNPTSFTNEKIVIEGSIPIAELVAHPEKYADKSIQISGQCVKQNTGIMDRNWIHLKDGSRDDFDLIVTSVEEVPKGKVVTMKGTVRLDRDFGAGYKYELIIEDGIVIK